MIYTVSVLSEDYKRASDIRFRHTIKTVPGRGLGRNTCLVGQAIERQIPASGLEVDSPWYWIETEMMKRRLPQELSDAIRMWQQDMRIHGRLCAVRTSPAFRPFCFNYNERTREVRYGIAL